MRYLKFLLCFALLVSGFEGRGQIYINSYRFGAGVADLLLDSFPNAAGAYSLRLLDKDYGGNCLTVRRTNGDTSLIGFSSNYLDTAALKTFCGTSSTDTCWVRRWFDQSGNARNIEQTTNSSQPAILVAGAIFYQGGKVTIDFDGTNDFLNVPQSLMNAVCVLNQAFSCFAPIKRDVINAFHPLLRANEAVNGNSIYSLGYLDGTARQNFFHRNASIVVVSNTGNDSITTAYTLTSWIYTGSNIEFFKNNASSGSFSHTFANTTASFGQGGIGGLNDGIGASADFFLNGKINEVIMYASDQGTNRSAINTNINTFYSIY